MFELIHNFGQFMNVQAKSWIIPGFDEYNCTNMSRSESLKGPSASDFLRRKSFLNEF